MLNNNWKKVNEGDLSEEQMILKFRKLTGVDSETAEEYLNDNNWDMDDAIAAVKGKKKKPKDKKVFKVGDIIVCIDPKPGKLPPDCVDFLLTYRKFKVLDVNDKLNINLGHRLAENDNVYYFSPNRFELMNGKAPLMKPDGTIVEAGSESPETKPLREKVDIKAKKILSGYSDYNKGKDDYDNSYYFDK